MPQCLTHACSFRRMRAHSNVSLRHTFAFSGRTSHLPTSLERHDSQRGRTWSDKKIGLTPEQKEYRILEMSRAFPEARMSIPADLTDGLTRIPDPNDRHVLAAAIKGGAQVIVTQNTKDFPRPALDDYGILCQTPDEFLIHQLTLAEDEVLEKLDAQAAALRKDRLAIAQTLKKMTPKFAQIIEERTL